MTRRAQTPIAAIVALVAMNAPAAVLLTLTNTVAMLDFDGSTLDDGGIVQLISVGPDLVRDAPDAFGLPGGDDSFVTLVNNPTASGYGVAAPDSGLVVAGAISFDDGLVGSTAYVRFWDGSELPLASYYGESMDLTLPVGSGFFNVAFLEFMPNTLNRQVDIAFSALEVTPVPEPSSVAVIVFLTAVLGLRRKWTHVVCTGSFLIAAAVGIPLLLPGSATAQLPVRLDVAATVPLVDSSGNPLPGNIPNAADFGFSPIPGALVHIIDTGPNGIPNLPDSAGNPAGGDTLLAEIHIGEGMPPYESNSGRFDVSLDIGTTDGDVVYARMFNGTNLTSSTRWGQSNGFTVSGSTVFRVNEFGLWGTIVPTSGSLAEQDTDGDGASDLDELLANTNADDVSDEFVARSLAAPPTLQVLVNARTGRSYELERTIENPGIEPSWTGITNTPMMTANQDLVLADPSPPATDQVFYRIRVHGP